MNFPWGQAFYLVLALAPGSAFADGEDFCKMQPKAPEVIAYIRGAPSFFAKVSADGRYLFYISNRNHILDLKRGYTVEVPGGVDPVPAPPIGPDRQVRHFTIPGPLRFYSLDEALVMHEASIMLPGENTNPEKIIQPVSSHPIHLSYQSVGLVSEKNGRPTYRVLIGSLEIYDFEGQPGGSFRQSDRSFNCGERGRYQLPMISKDGKEVGVYDTKKGVTKILKINDDGTCTEALDLGFPTGKVEFSYDGRAITFHVDTYDKDQQGRQFSGPSPRGSKNVYVMELDRSGGRLRAGALKRVTTNVKPGDNSYYPSFTLDGKIAYIHGERDSRGQQTFSFRRLDPQLSAAPVANYLDFQSSCAAGTAAAFALGDLMQNICKNLVIQNLSASEAAIWALGLDPDACKQLVDKRWNIMKSKIKKNETLLRNNRFNSADLSAVTKEAVLSACPVVPPGGVAKSHPPVIHDPMDMAQPEDAGTPEQFFTRRCYSCHDGGSAPLFEWNRLSLDQINRMLITLQEGTMPQGFVRDRERLVQPLVQRLLERQQEMEGKIANEPD